MGNENARPFGVLIVGEFPLVRRALRLLIESSPDFVVVDDLGDPEAAPGVVTRHAARLVLLDLPWSGPAGDGVVDRLAAAINPSSLVVLAPAAQPGWASRVGACLTKQSQPSEFLRGLGETARALNGHGFSQGRESGIGFRNGGPSLAPSLRLSAVPTLREAERELVRMIAEGLRSKEIADLFRLGCKSVETRRARLMRKLGCRNTVDLVRYAIREGIVPA